MKQWKNITIQVISYTQQIPRANLAQSNNTIRAEGKEVNEQSQEETFDYTLRITEFPCSLGIIQTQGDFNLYDK